MDRDKLYFQHIAEAIKKIRRYIGGVLFEKFRTDSLLQDAVVRELEIIGEAARNISEAAKKKHADVPWFEISGIRNRIVHEYFGIDIAVVWKTATEDLDVLWKKIEKNM